MHLTGVTAALSTNGTVLVKEALLRRPLGPGLASFDVNHRPSLWAAEDAAPVLLDLATMADLVLVGLDEAQSLWGIETAADVRRLIPQPERVAIKDSTVGATAFVGDSGPVFVPAPDVDVVEPIGAGDAFAAGYPQGHLLGLTEVGRLSIAHPMAAASLGVTANVGPIPDTVPRNGLPATAVAETHVEYDQ